MFDHVQIAVSDLAASERFYRTVLAVLGAEPVGAEEGLVEWQDWALCRTDREHPVSGGLHVGFRASDRAAVDAFWQAGVDAGYRSDGAPGPRSPLPGIGIRPAWREAPVSIYDRPHSRRSDEQQQQSGHADRR